jgi:hypothetical protein
LKIYFVYLFKVRTIEFWKYHSKKIDKKILIELSIIRTKFF